MWKTLKTFRSLFETIMYIVLIQIPFEVSEKTLSPSEAFGSDPLFPEVQNSKFQTYARMRSIQLLNKW